MASNYDVGNILINIQSKSKNIDEALKSTITNLKALKRSLVGISNLNLNKVQDSLNSISKLDFSGLREAFKPLETLDTKPLASFNRQIRNIVNLDFKKADFQKLYLQFLALNEIIDPFIQKIVKAEPSLKAFSNAIDLGRVNAQLIVAEAKVKAINEKSQSRKVLDDEKIKKANVQLKIAEKRLENLDNKSQKTAKSFKQIFDVGKIYLFINYARRWGRVLANTVTSAINFEETLNKFQVSMKINYSRSLEFVNGITKAFNLSTESVMDYMSTFKNMLSALGNLSEETSYELSETLTRMALDYASLFNVSTERAMEQFQAVLSGQIRSIRSVSGYDVSETSIYNVYKSLGGTKSMRQLDQIEKRLLRIIALQQQMEDTGAISNLGDTQKELGDFEKTINTTSNQLKQLKETFKEISRWLGQLTMHYIQPFVEKLLSASIAIRELLKYFNELNGYKYEDFTNGLFGEIADNATSAEEAVESLKYHLLGFDKLNVLGSTTSSNETDYDILLDKIKEYSSSLDEVNNKANEISIKILEWLGYTYDANGGLEQTGNRLQNILSLIKGVITTLVSFAIISKLKDIVGLVSSLIANLKNLGGVSAILKGVIGKLGIIGIIVTALIAGFVKLYNSNEEFKNKIDEIVSSFKEQLSPTFESLKKKLSDIYEKIKPFLDWLMDKALPFIYEVIVVSLGNSLVSIVNTVEAIVNAFSVLVDVVKVFWNIITSLPEMIKGIFMAIGGDSSYLDDWAEKLRGKLSGIIESLKEGIINLGKSILNIFITILNGAIDFINKIFTLKLPDWLGGYEFNWQIPKIPALASGGVITQPTTALVGEYAGASTNPEIVTPENLMREVFLESMLPIAQAIISGDKEVVSAINDLANRPVELNGRKVSENIYSDLQKVAMRKGQTMFASAR